jgi:toxin ParE1/3/4
MKVEYSPRAVADLREILEYVGRHNPRAAARLIDRLENACRGLTTMPAVGSQRDDLAPGLRALSEQLRHLFRPGQTSELIRIVRVLHSPRYPACRFQAREAIAALRRVNNSASASTIVRSISVPVVGCARPQPALQPAGP